MNITGIIRLDKFNILVIYRVHENIKHQKIAEIQKEKKTLNTELSNNRPFLSQVKGKQYIKLKYIFIQM